ncbi:hypothetical protein BDZ89DRAFT_1040261 [Hymenopellis radicata]|nr:hypothetical protein BDZ89DRAFT_1040261 [Hymenopellis radicata]
MFYSNANESVPQLFTDASTSNLEVAMYAHSFAITEDEPIHKIIRMCNVNARLISANTLSKDVKEVYDITKKIELPGCIHIVFNDWASGGKRSSQDLNAIFFNLVKVAIDKINLDMVPLHKRHTTAYLVKCTYDLIDNFSFLLKLFRLCGDNANTNLAMVREMGEILPSSSPVGIEMFIGCAGHQIDLGTKSTMWQFISKKLIKKGLEDYNVTKDFDEEGNIFLDDEDDLPTATDAAALDEEDREREEAVEAELDELIEALDEVQAVLDEDRKIAKTAVTKILKLGNHVFNSQPTQEVLAAQCKKVKIKPKKMIHMVATRWNSLFPILQYALELREPLDTLCKLPEFNKVAKRKLRKFRLTLSEWDVIEQLKNLLNVLTFENLVCV